MASGSADHVFFSSMAVASAVVVLAGFSSSYYLSPLTGAPPVSPLVHLHATVFSLWMVFYLVQNVLIATHRAGAHRRLGMAGAALAVAMIVVGCMTALAAARRGYAGTGTSTAMGLDAEGFLLVSLRDLVVFAIFVGYGLACRRRPDVHKRAMLLATAGTLVFAAAGRLPGGPPVTAAVMLTLLLAGPVYDWRSRQRVHFVYLWGVPFSVLTLLVVQLVAPTAAWHRVAGRLIGPD